MRINLETAEQPVVLLTSAFVTWRVYAMHHLSKASIQGRI